MSISLVIAVGLALACAMLTPLGDGLLDTSMLVVKMLAPTDMEDNEHTKRFLKVSQAAFMEGWLSNLPFIKALLGFGSVIAGFFYHWWGGILMFVVSATLGELSNLFFGRSVYNCLSLFYQKMIDRAADYRKENDIVRLDAAESCCRDLERIMLIYQDARIRPPTAKQLRSVPYGDLYYWLEHARD